MKWRELARHTAVAIGIMFLVAAGIYLGFRLGIVPQ
jgi:hypothetical protein